MKQLTFDEVLIKIRNAASCPKQLLKDANFRNLSSSVRNRHGDSVLHLLSAEGDPGPVKLAILLGVDVNAKIDFGSVPLTFAVYKKYREVVVSLLQAGADAKIKDTTNYDVLENFEFMGRNDLIEWFENVIRDIQDAEPKS